MSAALSPQERECASGDKFDLAALTVGRRGGPRAFVAALRDHETFPLKRLLARTDNSDRAPSVPSGGHWDPLLLALWFEPERREHLVQWRAELPSRFGRWCLGYSPEDKKLVENFDKLMRVASNQRYFDSRPDGPAEAAYHRARMLHGAGFWSGPCPTLEDFESELQGGARPEDLWRYPALAAAVRHDPRNDTTKLALAEYLEENDCPYGRVVLSGFAVCDIFEELLPAFEQIPDSRLRRNPWTDNAAARLNFIDLPGGPEKVALAGVLAESREIEFRGTFAGMADFEMRSMLRYLADCPARRQFERLWEEFRQAREVHAIELDLHVMRTYGACAFSPPYFYNNAHRHNGIYSCTEGFEPLSRVVRYRPMSGDPAYACFAAITHQGFIRELLCRIPSEVSDHMLAEQPIERLSAEISPLFSAEERGSPDVIDCLREARLAGRFADVVRWLDSRRMPALRTLDIPSPASNEEFAELLRWDGLSTVATLALDCRALAHVTDLSSLLRSPELRGIERFIVACNQEVPEQAAVLRVLENAFGERIESTEGQPGNFGRYTAWDFVKRATGRVRDSGMNFIVPLG